MTFRSLIEIDLEDEHSVVGQPQPLEQVIGHSVEVEEPPEFGWPIGTATCDWPIDSDESSSLQEVLERLHRAVGQAEDDRSEALAAIAALKLARSELKETNERDTRHIRRQMKAKKAAILLHLQYLEKSLKANRAFCNHVAAGTGAQTADIRKIGRALEGVFRTSHERIRSVIAMPIEQSKAYTKSIGLRTGATNKFLQDHPSVGVTGTIGAGVLATAGLTLIIGPFSLVALAIAIPAAVSLAEKQSHLDKSLKTLTAATHQMKSNRIRKTKDVQNLQRTLNVAAVTDRRVLPTYATRIKS